MSQLSVLVVGATGHQGGAVADHLLFSEYCDFDVHALTRSPESDRAQALADQGATVVKGNLIDKDDLNRAIKAVDAVYCVTTGGNGGADAEVEQGTNIAEVAADAGVTHIVFSSARGAERNTGIPHFEAKYAVEQRIRDLELPATIIRPVAFMQNYEYQREAILNGTLASPLDEGVSLQLVDTEDIGTLAAAAFAKPEEYIGETIELAGDEHTLEDAAEIFTTVTGTDVEAQHVPIEVAREEIGESLTMMFEWLNDHGFDNNTETLERDYDIDLTRLETYLHQHGWASERNQTNK
ncbi:NmrA/HSCARG family protein [Natrinema soli]|uniref:NmrA/HSCARG family protein n=1 Tax=Natrinema soli TaxID=1930624 RepID=A0ABD5SHM1_9EURY|nr:NmrA/HSCARG family protein [Natrinema soli]